MALNLRASGTLKNTNNENEQSSSLNSSSTTFLTSSSSSLDSEQAESRQQTIDRLVSKLQKLKIEAVESKNYDQANEYRKQIDQLLTTNSLLDVSLQR